jgi:hypothetical protein
VGRSRKRWTSGSWAVRCSVLSIFVCVFNWQVTTPDILSYIWFHVRFHMRFRDVPTFFSSGSYSYCSFDFILCYRVELFVQDDVVCSHLTRNVRRCNMICWLVLIGVISIHTWCHEMWFHTMSLHAIYVIYNRLDFVLLSYCRFSRRFVVVSLCYRVDIMCYVCFIESFSFQFTSTVLFKYLYMFSA